MFDAVSRDPAPPPADATAASRRRIAVIGSGIAGLSAAWLLSRDNDVTVFEAGGHVGGHSNTVDVALDGATVPVDTGFIVFNERTYPNLTALFAHLGVATVASDMSFGVSIDRGALEYAGAARLKGLFAQRRNVVRPRFWRLVADILRFYRGMARTSEAALAGRTLGQVLDAGGYGAAFRDDHLLPMAAAIWSGTCAAMLDFPAASFRRFCANHGLLQVSRRPRWLSVRGGSREYVRRLAAGVSGPIHLRAPVERVRRLARGVEIVAAGGHRARFDAAVIGAHADQALAMLETPTDAERRLLGAFPYQRNRAILHTDPALMPRRRGVWSSWNYMSDRAADPAAPVYVTYWMNRLQNLPTARNIFVSLNAPVAPRAGSVVAAFDYDHPQFDAGAIAAQSELHRIQGARGVWFCGAYGGYGFHEDGLKSGIAVARALGAAVPWRVDLPAAHEAPLLPECAPALARPALAAA
jgi:hypothetical protein